MSTPKKKLSGADIFFECLKKEGVEVSVINARFAKPVDENIAMFAGQGKTVITIEDHSLAAGFGSAVLELAAAKNTNITGRIINLGAADEFINVDTRNAQLDKIGVTTEKIINLVKSLNDSDQ